MPQPGHVLARRTLSGIVHDRILETPRMDAICDNQVADPVWPRKRHRIGHRAAPVMAHQDERTVGRKPVRQFEHVGNKVAGVIGLSALRLRRSVETALIRCDGMVATTPQAREYGLVGQPGLWKTMQAKDQRLPRLACMRVVKRPGSKFEFAEAYLHSNPAFS